jgi:hypothetical protein
MSALPPKADIGGVSSDVRSDHQLSDYFLSLRGVLPSKADHFPSCAGGSVFEKIDTVNPPS